MLDVDENVRHLAYRIWEQEGRPSGREVEHWLAAERHLRETPPGPALTSRGGAVPAKKARAPRKKK